MNSMKGIVSLILSITLMTACGGGGDTTSISDTTSIIPGDTTNLPTITISATSTNERPDSTISFEIIVTDYDSIQCDFDGDGSSEIETSNTTGPFSHTYENVGIYSASCGATNSDGLIVTSNIISVNIAYQTGDIVKSLPFPTGINKIVDIAYDSIPNSFWLLGFPDSTCNAPSLINIDTDTGSVITEKTLVNPPFFINCGSEMTLVNSHFYITSYGWRNGVPQQFIYELDMTGNVTSSFPCPAMSGGGFCEGLAWDGTHLWSGASDNKNLTRFTTAGAADYTLYDLWGTISIDDIAHETAKNQLVVLRSDTGRSIYKIDPSTGVIVNEFINSGSVFKGDWNSPNWISVNNFSQQIEQIYIGE